MDWMVSFPSSHKSSITVWFYKLGFTTDEIWGFWFVWSEDKRGKVGLHHEICRELGIEVDGRPKGKGSEVQGACL